MSDTRYCVDCTHVRGTDLGLRYIRCTRPGIIDLATGMPEERYCRHERSVLYYRDACGPEGRFFEKAAPEDTGKPPCLLVRIWNALWG